MGDEDQLAAPLNAALARINASKPAGSRLNPSWIANAEAQALPDVA